MTSPVRVLFLCMENSCRSQIAEALLRSIGKGRIEVYSAGQNPKPVHPLAAQVMSDVDIDMSAQASKPVEQFVGQRFDFVITVCDRAKETCPRWHDVREQIHWSFDDPAAAEGTSEQRLRVFRRVRDEIRQRLQLFVLANKLG